MQDLEILHRVMQKHDLSKGQTRGVLGLKLLVAELQVAKQAWLDLEQHNEKFLKTILLSTKETTPSWSTGWWCLIRGWQWNKRCMSSRTQDALIFLSGWLCWTSLSNQTPFIYVLLDEMTCNVSLKRGWLIVSSSDVLPWLVCSTAHICQGPPHGDKDNLPCVIFFFDICMFFKLLISFHIDKQDVQFNEHRGMTTKTKQECG